MSHQIAEINTNQKIMKNKIVYAIMGVVFSLLSANTNHLKAQQHRIELDTINLEYVGNALRQYVNHMAFDPDFNYRSEIKEARRLNNMYVLNEDSIPQAHLMKHLKKAARKTDNVDDFRAYFIDSEIDFLSVMDGRTVTGLYNTLRRSTLPGFLDELDKAFGSL